MSERPAMVVGARQKLTICAMAVAWCLLLTPSVLVVVNGLRGELGAVTFADVFWIGWLPVALYIGVRYFSVLRDGVCPTNAPAGIKEQER